MLRGKNKNSVLIFIEGYTKAILKFKRAFDLFGKKFLSFFILLFILFAGTYSFAQKKELRFRNPQLQLSDYSVFRIIEDYKGFMWFATENGLNRFDGNDTYVYSNKYDDSTSISNNRIVAFCETRNKELWIGTASGLNFYNREQNNFIQYFYKRTDGQESAYNTITDIVEGTNGNLWLATTGGMCVFDVKSETFVSLQTYTKNLSAIGVTNIEDILIYKKDRVLAGVTDGRIFEINMKSGEIVELFFDNGGTDKVEVAQINCFLKAASGTIWLGTLEGGLIKIRDIKGSHIWYSQYTHLDTDNNSISLNDILSLCELDKDNLMVGTDNGGLNVLNYKSGKFTRIVKNRKKENSISGNSIWTMYKDRSHRIWFGIYNQGVDVIDSLPPKFNSSKNNIYDGNSLCSSPVTGFAEDEDGNMWISTDGCGVEYWDRKINRFVHFNSNAKKTINTESDAAMCLLKTKRNGVWIGFYNGGIVVVGKDGKIMRRLNEKSGLSANSVFSIDEDSKGNIYIATLYGGLDVYDVQTGDITVYKHDETNENSLMSNNINVLFVDKNDNLWLGLFDGGLDYGTKTENGEFSFVHYQHEDIDTNTISNDYVFAIIEDKKDNIWVGTGDGLDMFNVETQKFTTYRMPGGLTENTIFGVLEDDSGMFWLSTLDGICKFNPETNFFNRYNKSDGLHGLRFNNRASYYKSKKGEMFFGGNAGFTYFNPDSIKLDERFPKLYLTDFKLFNKPVSIGEEGQPLKKHISQTEKLSLTYKQSVFTIEYAALNFKNPKKTQYAYMLAGFETEWNYVGGKRTATYTNLNPRKYTFKVKCTNGEGVWNEDATTLEIEVLPPWWATWWFRVMVIVTVLLMLYILYYLKMRSIKKQRRILEETVKSRTIELNETNASLEEKNEEIVQQKEELQVTAETLEKTNRELEQNTIELSLHKNKLEDLVKIRTAELEKSKRKAEESDRLKSAFLANMSHEIRTPMNAIVGFSQLLNLPDVSESDKRKYLKQISTNTNSLLVLIEDILDLSRIESNHISIIKEKFFVNALLDEVFSSISVSYKNNSVKLLLANKEAERNVMIDSDRDRIKQVLMNLFTNACKFTEKGFVNLGFEIKDGVLLFHVRDTGIGILEEHLDTIFDRFRKVADNKTKLFRGTGLGLAISKKIAKLLGGDLHVQSEFGKGSIFTFSLPESVLIQK
jgi:signal transduction histidine kinase/ligand-binding sensor domain-containing protein